jgi:hypothetical protein
MEIDAVASLAQRLWRQTKNREISREKAASAVLVTPIADNLSDMDNWRKATRLQRIVCFFRDEFFRPSNAVSAQRFRRYQHRAGQLA